MKKDGRAEVLSGRRWGDLAKVAFAVVAVALLTWALAKEWGSFVDAIKSLTLGSLAVASISAVFALVCSAMSWRASFLALGMSLDVLTSLRVYFESQIGKYIPGSVWPVVSQMEMAKSEGFSRVRSGTAAVLAMIVGVVTSGSVAAILLVASSPSALKTYWYVLLAVGLGAIVISPGGLRLILGVLGRVFRKKFDTSEINGHGILLSVGWGVLMWLSYGVHTWVILGDLTGPDRVSFISATAAFTLAWVVGFLVVIAPAGVGIREAVMVVVLSGSVDERSALAFAVISRVILTVVDGLAAGGAFVIERPWRRFGRNR